MCCVLFSASSLYTQPKTHAMRTAKIIHVKSTHAAACACSFQLAFTKVNSLEKAPGRGAGEPVRDAAQTSLPRCEVEAGSRTTRGIPSRRKSFGGQTQRARP